MQNKAEQLTLAILGVVQQDWPMLSDHWKRMFGIDVANDIEAQSQFAMAALAVGLGDNPSPAFCQAVHDWVVDSFKSAGFDLEKDLHRYENVWADWKNVSGRFLVPPLEHRLEAIGIAFADLANIKSTVTIIWKRGLQSCCYRCVGQVHHKYRCRGQ